MVESVRFVIYGAQGKMRCNHNWSAINRYSVVVITACEWNRNYEWNPFKGPGLEPQVEWPKGRTHLGNASVYVTNIGQYDRNEHPGDGGVEFFLHAEADGPIDVQVTISVLGYPIPGGDRSIRP